MILSAPYLLAPDVPILEYAGVYEETVQEVTSFMKRAGTQRAVVVAGFGRQGSFRCSEG